MSIRLCDDAAKTHLTAILQQRGLELMFPYALTVCHAKGVDFPPSRRFDFGRWVRISKMAHFTGGYSAEFGGDKSPYDGVQDLIAALEQDV